MGTTTLHVVLRQSVEQIMDRMFCYAIETVDCPLPSRKWRNLSSSKFVHAIEGIEEVLRPLLYISTQFQLSVIAPDFCDRYRFRCSYQLRRCFSRTRNFSSLKTVGISIKSAPVEYLVGCSVSTPTG